MYVYTYAHVYVYLYVCIIMCDNCVLENKFRSIDKKNTSVFGKHVIVNVKHRRQDRRGISNYHVAIYVTLRRKKCRKRSCQNANNSGSYVTIVQAVAINTGGQRSLSISSVAN